MKTSGTNSLKNAIAFGDWIPKKVVQDFFNYGNTKMSTFSSDYNVKTSKVGKRIFYKYSDVLRLFEESTTD